MKKHELREGDLVVLAEEVKDRDGIVTLVPVQGERFTYRVEVKDEKT